jgi:hypothetical protein
MARSKLKTDNFTTKRKYRSVRSALNRIDSIWLKLGFQVKVSKQDGQWVAVVGGDA